MSYRIGQSVSVREDDNSEPVKIVRFERVGMNDKVVIQRSNGEQHTMFQDEIEGVES